MNLFISVGIGFLLGLHEVNGYSISLYFILLTAILLPSVFFSTKYTVYGDINFEEQFRFVLENRNVLFAVNFLMLISGFIVAVLQYLMIQNASYNYFYGVGIWVGILLIITSIFSTIMSNYLIFLYSF